MPTATVSLVFLTSFGVGFSGAITPGPLLVYNIRETIRIGHMAGPLVVAGHAILELLVVIGLTLGVIQFLKEDVATAAISFLGGLFLLWMGWGMVHNPSRHVSLPDNPTGTAKAQSQPILGGALVSLSNPFWSLWWATIGLNYLVWSRDLGVLGVASFYTGHILSDLVWYSLVSFAIASGRRIMNPATYKALMVVCGLFLLALGVYFIASGASLLAG